MVVWLTFYMRSPNANQLRASDSPMQVMNPFLPSIYEDVNLRHYILTLSIGDKFFVLHVIIPFENSIVYFS